MSAGPGSAPRRRLLWRASLRHHARHRGQLALSVLGVALGVGVVVGIRLANASARRAFELSAETVAGRATDVVVGGPEGLADSVYRALRVEAGVRPSAPVVEGDVVPVEHPGQVLRLLGVDPFAERDFRPELSPAPGGAVEGGAGPPAAPGAVASTPALDALLTVPGAVLLAGATARELGLVPGDTFSVRVGGATIRRLILAGVVQPSGALAREGARNLIVADIATAQAVLDRIGRLDRIDLIAPRGPAGASLLARARAALPADAEIVRAGSRTNTLEQMTSAFSLNLTALGLLALIFGMFLIYDSTSFGVVQRRTLIGTLRALGVTRGEVFAVILVEGVCLGIVGTALGLGLGVALAQGLVQLVTRTINDLWFVVSVRSVALPPGTLAIGAALGVGATVLATLPAALEATLAPPRATLTRSVLEARVRRLVPRAAAAGGLLCVAGAAVLAVPSRNLVLAFGGLFAIVLGGALLTPAATVALMALVRPPLRRLAGVLGGMAARGVSSALSRTAPAVAALCVAVSVTVALGVMIGSFRRTVQEWLGTTLQADVYVSAPSPVRSRPEGTLEPTLVRRLSAVPGVAAVTTNRNVLVHSPAGETRLVALALDGQGLRTFDFKAGNARRIWPLFRDSGRVIVSEPFAYRRGVGLGDSVRLRTDRGLHAFPVAGVFYDYASDQGLVMMSRRTYERYWRDRGITAMGLYAAAGVTADTLVARLRARAGGDDVLIRSNRALRAASLQVFDRTFAITGVLRLLAFVVAFVGVLGALMALQLERARELGVLRATGLTREQLWALVTTQTGLIGLAAGLLSLPLGLVMAAVMVYVINRRSFGWTLHFVVGPEVLLQAVGLALVAAVIAGLYPAWRMARTPPAVALREE